MGFRAINRLTGKGKRIQQSVLVGNYYSASYQPM